LSTGRFQQRVQRLLQLEGWISDCKGHAFHAGEILASTLHRYDFIQDFDFLWKFEIYSSQTMVGTMNGQPQWQEEFLSILWIGAIARSGKIFQVLEVNKSQLGM